MLRNVSTNHFVGFSFSDKMPTTHEEVADNLYEFLQQWFQLFPEYQVSIEHTADYTLYVYLSSFVEQSLLSIWRILWWKVGSEYCKEDS